MSCMIVSLLSGFITSTNILLRILFIFNFSISAGIFRKFYYCTIFCSTFSWDLLFLSCSDFIFLKQKRHFVISFTDLVDFVVACESVEVFSHTKKKELWEQTAALLVHCREICSDMTVYVFHFPQIIQIEPMLVTAIIFHLRQIW